MELAHETAKDQEHRSIGLTRFGPSPSSLAALHPIFRLQQQAGNHAVQAFLHRAGIQAKLAVSQPGDPAEREADQVADRIMRKHGGAPTSSGCSCAAGGDMCEECQQTQQPVVARKADGGFNANEAPPLVADVLRSSGEPLVAAARSSLEPKFGRDLGSLRIHDDSRAAESASAIDALAYTLGNHIVFGAGQYTPGTPQGDRLLAHEITHTIQQDGATAGTQPTHGVLHRACRSGPQCATGFPGDPGRYDQKVEAEEEAARAASGPPPVTGGPATCQNPHHRERAVSVETLVASAGVTPPADVSGLFINACMAAGGSAESCNEFPGGVPSGADPAKTCVEVNLDDENAAKAILGKPVRNAADNAKVADLSSLVLHEVQHTRFDKNPSSIVPARPDCNVNTVIFHGPTPAPGGTDYQVSYYLSEMSAEIAEFPPYFQNTKSSPGKDTMKQMFDEERNIGFDADESILGIIRSLQCKCDCGTVDGFTANVFNNVTGSWPPDQRDEFQKAMTRMMPSFWPKALQKT